MVSRVIDATCFVLDISRRPSGETSPQGIPPENCSQVHELERKTRAKAHSPY